MAKPGELAAAIKPTGDVSAFPVAGNLPGVLAREQGAQAKWEKKNIERWAKRVREGEAQPEWVRDVQDISTGILQLGAYGLSLPLALGFDSAFAGAQAYHAAPGERLEKFGDNFGFLEHAVGHALNPASVQPVAMDRMYKKWMDLPPEERQRTLDVAEGNPGSEEARLVENIRLYKLSKERGIFSGAFSSAAPVGGSLPVKVASSGATALAGLAAEDYFGDESDTGRDARGTAQMGAGAAGLTQTALSSAGKGIFRGILHAIQGRPPSIGEAKGLRVVNAKGVKALEFDDPEALHLRAWGASANSKFADWVALHYKDFTPEQMRVFREGVNTGVMDVAKPIVRELGHAKKHLDGVVEQRGARAAKIRDFGAQLRQNLKDEKARVSKEFYGPLDREVLAPFSEGGKSMDAASAKARLEGVVKGLAGHDLPVSRKLKGLLKSYTEVDPATKKRVKKITMMDLENARSDINAIPLKKADGTANIGAKEREELVAEMDAILAEQLGAEDFEKLLDAREQYGAVMKIYGDKGGKKLGGLMDKDTLPEDVFAKLFPQGGGESASTHTAGLLGRLALAAGKGDHKKGSMEVAWWVSDMLSDEKAVRLFGNLKTQDLYPSGADDVFGLHDDAMQILANRAFRGYLGVSRAVVRGEGGAIAAMNKITPQQIKAIREHAISGKGRDPAVIDRTMQSAYMLAKFDDMRLLMNSADAAGGKLDPDEVNEAMLRGFRKLLGSSDKDKQVFDALFEAKAGDEISPRQRFEFFGMVLDGAMRIKRGQSASEILADSEWYKHADETSKQILAWIRQYYFPISPVAVISGMATRQIKKHARKNKVDAMVQDLLRPGLESDKVAKEMNKLIKLFRIGKANSKELSREMDRVYRAAAEHNDDGATLMGRKEDEE